MLFFQVLLLAGYAYAHWLIRFSARAQAVLHCAALASSLVLLVWMSFVWASPITPGSSWKPQGADHPIVEILSLLSVSVGLPFFVLSSTAPLLQAWYFRGRGDGSPYRLYALSNLGSFLSLLAFPVLLEPGLTLKSQAWVWFSAYLLFALSCMYNAARAAVKPAQELESDAAVPLKNSVGTGPGITRYLLWGALSACASILFLATTSQICQDIGVVPLLWIVPLGVYLLTFVICFEHDGWYPRKWFHVAFAVALWCACFVLYNGAVGSILEQIGIYVLVLFVCCMVCNGELARSKPRPEFLTSFYLMVAFGGAAGGIFVALVAPHIFRGFWEYQLGLWIAALLLVVILVRDKDSWLYRDKIASPVLVVAVAFVLPESATITVTQTNRLARVTFPCLLQSRLVGYASSQPQKKRIGFGSRRKAKDHARILSGSTASRSSYPRFDRLCACANLRPNVAHLLWSSFGQSGKHERPGSGRL